MNIALFQKEYFGNSTNNYLLALGVLVAGMVVIFILRKILKHNIKSIENDKSGIKKLLEENTSKLVLPVLYFAALYLAVKQLTLPANILKILSYAATLILTIQGIRLMLSLSAHFIKRACNREGAKARALKTNSLLTITRILIWGCGIMFLLDNLGVNITTVIAGLGIGGVAVALAAQTILGDIFNYFVILFDKPFEEGDFIIVDDFLGVIEHIGIKSTHVRSLGGEQLVFSNSDLCSSRIKNYKRMEKRRVVFKLGVTYQTSYEKIKKAPGIIKGIIENVADTAFDRCHFNNFGDFSLEIEIVYYVLTGDYNKYMDIQQEINLAIKHEFEKEGMEFAYPTQTVFVEK